MQFVKLREWADGKHPLLAMYAHSVALGADSTIALCEMVRNKTVAGCFGEDYALLPWFKHYSRRRKTIGRAWQAYERVLEFPDELHDELAELVSAWRRKDGSYVISWTQAENAESRLVTRLLDWHYRQIETEGAQEPDVEELLKLPDALFMFRASIPCEVLWQQPVIRMFWNARRGDALSIGRMTALDPLLLMEPKIRAHRQEIIKEGGARHRLLVRGEQELETMDLSRSRVKVLLAGLISRASRAFDREMKNLARLVPGIVIPGRMNLREPDIRELFNAVADDTKGLLQDDDLPQSPEAFSKAIQRARKFWPKL